MVKTSTKQTHATLASSNFIQEMSQTQGVILYELNLRMQQEAFLLVIHKQTNKEESRK